MITVSSASALITANALNSATFDASKAAERISTGKRINRASDDPSGLVRALTIKADIGSYTKALDNINAGTEAMDKIATALASIYEILTEMKGLTTSAQLDTATDDDIAAYQASFIDYISDITTLSDQVTVAGDTVMDDANDTVIIQVGIATASTREFDYVDTSIDTLGLDSATIDFADSDNTYSTSTVATAAVFSTAVTAAYSAVDDAMDTVAGYISTIASAQIVLNINTDFVNSMIKNNSISYGKIMDANYAKETANLASAQVRQSSAAAMLAQSNSMTKDIVNYLLKTYSAYT
jgi:flagellin